MLGEFADLIGQFFNFSGNRQRDITRDADNVRVQLCNPRRGVGATARRGNRLVANGGDLLPALIVFVRLRLQLLDTGAILGDFDSLSISSAR